MTYQEIAVIYRSIIIGALRAYSFNNFDDYHELTDRVSKETGCELWELVEAIDLVRNDGHDYKSVAAVGCQYPKGCGWYSHRYSGMKEPVGGLSGDHPDIF